MVDVKIYYGLVKIIVFLTVTRLGGRERVRQCSDQNEVMSVLCEKGRTEQPEMEAKGRWMIKNFL